MGAPTRFNNGVTNVAKSDVFGEMPLFDFTKVSAYVEDFFYYVTGFWTRTLTGVATTDLTDADGGVLRLTNAGANSDAAFFQKRGESFKFEVGKKLAFKARFRVDDATNAACVMGLQITDTTPLDVTDGVFFIKNAASTTLNLLVEKDNVATTTAITTMADDTYIEVGFYYDGVNSIKAFLNGNHVATSAVTNLPDDEDLTISFGVQNGTAAARRMDVDYIIAMKER